MKGTTTIVVWKQISIETNSHQCNEYIIKNYKHQGLWNADNVTSGTFRVWHIFGNW